MWCDRWLLRLSLTRGTVSADGRTAELSRNELRILAHLMTHAGEIVSRADLIEALWDSQIYIDDNTLSVNVTRLRGKLEALGVPGMIRTRRGMGYQYMTVLEFLSDRLGRLVLWGAARRWQQGFCWPQEGLPQGFLSCCWRLCFWLLAAQAQVFQRMRRTIETWERLLEGLDQKYLFPECAPKPQRLYERKLLDITRRSGQAMIGAVSEAQAAQRDYREYVERWVHEIKTPITAARLMARRSGADTRRKLEAELDQIGAHVERALFYARAENPEKDVLIHPANLSDLVNQAVQAHRALLLQNGVSVELCDLDFVVYTDRKWVCFLLGQLLQNAARYRRARPVIALSARRQEKRVELTVSDNGMGIPAHELPRVFDRGFTGSNGRLRGGSTGMGLYLAKKLADALEISLAIRSEEGVGTQVLLTFPAQEKLTKL